MATIGITSQPVIRRATGWARAIGRFPGLGVTREAAALSPALRDEVEVEKLLQLNRNQLVAAIIGLINPVLLTSVLWMPSTRIFLSGWLALGLLFCAVQVRAWHRNRYRPRPRRAPRNLDLRVCLAAIVGSLYWAVLSLVAIPEASETGVLAIVIVVCGTGVGGAVLLSLVPMAAAIYFALTFVPTIGIVLVRQEDTPWLLVLLILNLFLFMTFTVHRLYRVFFNNWANAVQTSRLAEAARAAERTKAEFVANMSHELRTPLNAINGFSEAMAAELFGDLGSDRYRSYAQDIQASGHRLLEIINDLIDISRIEAGRYELRIVEVSLAAGFEQGCGLASRQAADAGVEIRPHRPDTGLYVRVDRTAFPHLVMHLLLQAIWAVPRGAVIDLEAMAGRDGVLAVSLRASHPDGLAARIGVGAGDAGTAADGRAVGLALCRALMRLHGGELVLPPAPAPVRRAGGGPAGESGVPPPLAVMRFPAGTVCPSGAAG